MTVPRDRALNLAAEVLDRADWLLVDRLAEQGDENASESADAIVALLREEADRTGAKVEPNPGPLIRITVERQEYVSWTGATVEPRTVVKEFDDVGEADSWLSGDSYVAEPYVRRLTWERLR